VFESISLLYFTRWELKLKNAQQKGNKMKFVVFAFIKNAQNYRKQIIGQRIDI